MARQHMKGKQDEGKSLTTRHQESGALYLSCIVSVLESPENMETTQVLVTRQVRLFATPRTAAL